MNHEYALDMMGGIFFQPLTKRRWINRCMASKVEHLHIEPHHSTGVRPTVAESTAGQCQNGIARAKQVTEGSFPYTVPVRHVQRCLTCRARQPPKITQNTVSNLDQFTFVNIRCGPLHGPQDSIRHNRWTGG